MKLVVGLGNPGEKYQNTRHNLGFMVVDKFVAHRLPTDYDTIWENEPKFKAEVCRLKSEDLILVKPQTYMNNSGLAVSALVNFFKIPLEDVVIVHDDLDLLLGKIKVRTGGSAAGHHGVESIISSIGDGFTRVRVGIGNKKSHLGEHQRVHFEAEKFVLDQFSEDERLKLKHILKQTISALTELIGSAKLG